MAFSKASNDFFKVADNEGRLVLVQGTDYLLQQPTDYGIVDIAEGDVVVLDGPEAGREYDGARFFQSALRSSVKRTIGKDPLLGRIGKGQKKGTNSPPWLFMEPTDADIAVAEKYQADHPAETTAPATSVTPFGD
jgi:hypothetical protein